MRLETALGAVFFCFFYEPGAHHCLLVRSDFNDAFSKCASYGKAYLMGDTNARLCSLLNDRNVNGRLISNRNKTLFLEYLEYSWVVILNKR